MIVNFKEDIDKKLCFINCDIRDHKALNQIFLNSSKEGRPIDGVIHLAGLKSVEDSLNSPIKYWDYNVHGTINLINVMNKNNCKLIVFSSSATIYGLSKKNKIDENSLKSLKTLMGLQNLLLNTF